MVITLVENMVMSTMCLIDVGVAHMFAFDVVNVLDFDAGVFHIFVSVPILDN